MIYVAPLMIYIAPLS